MSRFNIFIVALLLSVLVTGDLLADQAALDKGPIEPFSEPQILEAEGFRDFYAQVAPTVYMAGQPSVEGLAKVRALGVSRVINLRTNLEMDNRDVVPFDEAAEIAALEMDYVHIPLGGPDTPYTPQAVDQFAKALASADGNVLLHCTVAWRATHMWTAYLVRHHGLSVQDAVAIGRQLNLGGLPLEGFLGEELVISVKPPEPQDG